jgi:hypothetical protein
VKAILEGLMVWRCGGLRVWKFAKRRRRGFEWGLGFLFAAEFDLQCESDLQGESDL